jgi:hypothetical protein
VLKIILLKIFNFVNFSNFLIFFFSGMPWRGACQALLFVIESQGEPQWSGCYTNVMKNEFSFLYPHPKNVQVREDFFDIRDLCFPLEIYKKYDFLFDYFGIRNKNRGLEIVFHECQGLTGEEYVLESDQKRILVLANSSCGQFYALSTLLQILSFHGDAGCLPAFSLRDAPAIAFRGAYFSGAASGAGSDPSALQRLLLQLALLKFNHLALPAAGSDAAALAGLARRMGMVILFLDPDPRHLAPVGGRSGSPPDVPAPFVNAAAEKMNGPAAWFDFFLGQCRTAKAGGGKLAAWGDLFLSHREWIRRIPHDALVLNRERGVERGDFFKAAVLPFKEHHVHQVLCPTLCDRGRFFPDARAAMSRVHAAFAAAGAGKLAGVMVNNGDGTGDGCLPQGAALALFQAGGQLWSGRLPGPAAFSRWALGRDEPDLFRVFSFLAQAEHRLTHSHNRYLFEDPLTAPFSRQGDPREVVAHFRKAALYLQKREFAAGDLSGFLEFVRRLYEFIATKVEFSLRLRTLAREAFGNKEIRSQAMRLERMGAKLQDCYLGLWSTLSPAALLPEVVRSFDFMRRRLRNIGESMEDLVWGEFSPGDADDTAPTAEHEGPDDQPGLER